MKGELTMNDQKRKVIERLEEKIQALQHTIEIAKNLPDDLPDEAEIHAIANCLFIHIPFNWDLFRATRKALDGSGTAWIPNSTWTSDSDGKRVFCYYLPGDRFCLQILLEPLAEGARCRREQVGIKEIPIYRAVCD